MSSLFSCGERIRTNDLWVMSPTSYPCSTPRCFDDAKVVLFLYSANFFVLFLCFSTFFSLRMVDFSIFAPLFPVLWVDIRN